MKARAKLVHAHVHYYHTTERHEREHRNWSKEKSAGNGTNAARRASPRPPAAIHGACHTPGSAAPRPCSIGSASRSATVFNFGFQVSDFGFGTESFGFSGKSTFAFTQLILDEFLLGELLLVHSPGEAKDLVAALNDVGDSVLLLTGQGSPPSRSRPAHPVAMSSG